MPLVLIHSPLVGPGTWAPVARELERRGHEAIVPSLLGVADAAPPQWRHCPEAVRAATEHLRDPLVLVGHSGAGLLLPAIADALDREISALVFVDSFLPPASGSMELAPPPFLEQLRRLATGGVLPPWSSWFGEHGLRDLIPDPRLRESLEHEMPRLPLAYFEAEVPQPNGWDRRWPCGCLLFARDPYGAAASEARKRQWPTIELPDTHHLALVTEPAAVTDALLDVTRKLNVPHRRTSSA